MTSLTTTEALVRRLRWTLAKVLPTKKLLIIRKSTGRPSRRNFTRWLTGTCIATTVGRADEFLRFFSRILAWMPVFRLNEASFHPAQNPPPAHLTVQPAGLSIRKTNKLVRFVTSVFTDSSSEIAAERFPFEMFLMAPSTKSCKEMLSSYCTLFPLNAKKFEAFDSVYSFLSCDCVAASLPSR